MKLSTSVILTVFFISVHSQSADEIAIRDHFSMKCRKYSTNAVSYDYLTEQIRTFMGYFEYSLNTLMVDKIDFCRENRPTLETTFNQLADYLYQCLPPSEKYLRNFLKESFHEVLELLCRQNGRIIDNFKSTHGQQCRNALAQANATQEINVCLNNIFAPLRESVKKAELCEDISVMKNCFSKVLSLHCPDFTSFHTMNSQLFRAISKPCSACAYTTLSMLLIVLCYFATKLF